MRGIFLLLLLNINFILLHAQKVNKPPIDTSVFNKWPSVIVPPVISNDGRYSLYTIHNQPAGNATLVIRALAGHWKMECPGLANALFTDDSRFVVFLKPNDSLCIVALGSSLTEHIYNVRSFHLFKQEAEEWLACQLNTPAKELFFLNLRTRIKKSFSGVSDYMLSKSSKNLLLQSQVSKDKMVVQLVNFQNGNTITIWEGSKPSGFVFDASDNQLAFVVCDKIMGKSIWYYKRGYETSVLLMDNQSEDIDKGLEIGGILTGFSVDGKRLFITLTESELREPQPNAVMINVWSYTDTELQSQQLKESGLKSYAAVLNIHDRRLVRLQQDNETIQLLQNEENDDWGMISDAQGVISERNWNTATCQYNYIVATHNGARKKIDIKGTKSIGDVNLSPSGKYIVCTSLDQGDYFSYEIATGSICNLTRLLPIPLIDEEYDTPDRRYRGLSFAAWLRDGKSVLINDKYDIWQIDLVGRRSPINITNGYGKENKIVFRLAGYQTGTIISTNENLILTAFNKTNKQTGFFSKMLHQKGDPELLTIGPYNYNLQSRIKSEIPGNYRYLVSRSSSTQSSNYFWTTDFAKLEPITDVYPENSYNWLTTELLSWKTLDGRNVQGVLYKPENFDGKKKYPVIIDFYEKVSDGLNNYENPEVSAGWINIPWFVSNGYLVFAPDIYFQIGQPGRSAFNSVVSAAKYLSKFPWVDSSKIGISGHSFGGYETNYIVTHTNLFAAALSSAGVSDMISEYGSIGHGDKSKQRFFELGQYRIGASLWERPDLYVKNSPIFRADKIVTPLLMMNNQGDQAVSVAQGVEFFTALRRLGKKVWMLQYDGEDHSLLTERASVDYTIRITQFFDHYLKNRPVPKWMLYGIPARYKGIDSGLELVTKKDSTGKWLTPESKRKLKKADTYTPIFQPSKRVASESSCH